jgi:transcriptional regulator with XRE-family HTH domain
MKKISGIGENVRQLRHEKNLTQSDLAVFSGLSLPTIKNIEGGKDIAKYSTLTAIAKILGVDTDTLLSPSRHFSTVRFRSDKKLRLKWQILSEMSKKLDKYCELEKLNRLYLPPQYENIREKDPVKLASNLRRKLKLSPCEAVPDISAVAAHLGIKLLNVDVDTDKFHGLSVGRADGGPAVIVNVNWRSPYERIVYTIARDIAHLILHPKKNKDRIRFETDEAEIFASHFLLPEDGLKFHWNNYAWLHWTDRILKLKHIYGICCQEILLRLQKFTGEERLAERFADYFKGNTEPYSLKKFFNPEERFIYIVLISISKNFITLENASNLLNIPEKTVNLILKDINFLSEV